MPKFFFNVHYGEYIPDEEGTELPDVAASRREAAKYAAALLVDHPQQAGERGGWSVEVTDDHRLVLFKLIVQAVPGLLSPIEKPVS